MNDFIPTGNVYRTGAGEAVPDAELLNGRCVAFKVHEGVLKEIAEASGAEAVRYVGAYEDGQARLCTADADAAARGEFADTGVLYDLYVYVPEAGEQFFAVEADDSARLAIPALGVNIVKSQGRLDIARASGYAAEAGFYRIAELSYVNIAYSGLNAEALKVSHDTQEIEGGDYAGNNTFKRSFSDAPNAVLYVLVRGEVPEKSPRSAGESENCSCSCDCPEEGSGTAAVHCAEWEMAFGRFPQMAGMPTARVRLYSAKLNAQDWMPSALKADHPMRRELVAPESDDTVMTVVPPYGEAVRYDAASGLPTEESGAEESRLRFLDADCEPCARAEAVYAEEVMADGSSLRYPLAGGRPVRMVTSADVEVTAEEFAEAYEVLSAESEDGTKSLRQIRSSSMGVLQIEEGAEDSSGMRLSLYPLDQVGAKGGDGLYAVTGTPIKTVTVIGEAGSSLRIAEQSEEGVPIVYTWSKDGDDWQFRRGDSASNALESCAEEAFSPTAWSSVKTVADENGAILAASSVQYRRTRFGQVIDRRTEGCGTEERVTRSLYGEVAGRSDYGRILRRESTGGSYTRYAYDEEGRVVLTASPCAVESFPEKGIRTAYATGKFYDCRPALEQNLLINADGTETVLSETAYAYEDSATLHRVTVTRRSADDGLVGERTRIEERFGTNATPAYARGRVRFTQEENGVQEWHSYEETAEYGACVKHTAESRVNSEAVNGRSRRTAEYFSLTGLLLRQEEYVLTTAGEWELISVEEYLCDHFNREVKRTKGNGRIRTQEWMCCGLASATDENGITVQYAYDSAKRLIEIERSEAKDGEVMITPASVTAYRLDGAGRRIGEMKSIGGQVLVTSASYDTQGRVVSQTDVLGRVTRTAYSADGLKVTVTLPSGATRITERHSDGSTARESGTGQRELVYRSSLENGCLKESVCLADGTFLSARTVNGFGETIEETEANTTGGVVRTLRTYNSKGQLVRQWRDAGEGTATAAATLCEYDSFGTVSRETLALSEEPSTADSPVTETAYGTEVFADGIIADGIPADGVYEVVTRTRYNAAGEALVQTQKTLISELSGVLEHKVIVTDERGQEHTEQTEYGAGAVRIHSSVIPTSNITAVKRETDGFVTQETDHSGIVTRMGRSFEEGGMRFTQTDGRNNTVLIETDLAGRTVKETDAEGNSTVIEYDPAFDQPACITDAQGNTVRARYDLRGRKVAEWRTGAQPVTSAYDEADRLIALTTFRDDGESADTDPSDRTDGDTTSWAYDDATGQEVRKTYADGSSVVKTYDAFNRLATETNARGVVKTYSYEQARGLLTGISFSDATPAQSYAYNHLGQLTQVTDAAGTRSIAYDAYGDPETDSLQVGSQSHLITEQKDAFGRSTGYIYARSGAAQHTVSVGYGADGRIATAGFLQGSAEKQFTYQYLEGSNLLHCLTMPNAMTLEWGYEAHRDLVTSMTYKRGTSTVVARGYVYDVLSRPVSRQTTRQGNTVNDSFSYNSRSELIGAAVSGKTYGYSYDNIGNRKTAQEDAEEVTAYTANPLNQYTAIQQGEDSSFTPTYDADGNQTRIKTATGIWNVTYNAENRPIRFESEDGASVIECAYDYMGRRHTRKVTVNGTVSSYLRYIYRGYLQIAAIDAVSGVFRWFLVWDPTQPTATRPLAIRKDQTWYAYGWDITKNVTEIFGKAGYLRTAYTYTPYGTATAEGDVTQPLTWSSEYADEELALIYYNYRHYNPTDGRWINRDPIGEQGGWNLYAFVENNSLSSTDIQGLFWWIFSQKQSIEIPLLSVKQLEDRLKGKQGFYKKNYPWISVGISQLGLHEVKDRKKIESYAKTFPLNFQNFFDTHPVTTSKGAWCGCFVYFCTAMSNLNLDLALNTKRDPYNLTRALKYKEVGKKSEIPIFGAIAVIKMVGKDGRITYHVGFVVAENTDSVFLLGGNQSNMVKVSDYPKKDVVTYQTMSASLMPPLNMPDTVKHKRESTR